MTPARLNPFRTERVEAMPYRFRPGWSWSRLVSEWERVSRRAAIVGPHGSGKTTLLEQLSTQLGSAARPVRLHRLNEHSDRAAKEELLANCASWTRETILLLDGAEQFGWLDWRRFLRATRDLRGVIITGHRAGRLPTIYQCETSAALLGQLGSSLLAEPIADAVTFDWPRLFERHEGNLREAFRDCYAQVAGNEGQPAAAQPS